MTLSRLFTIILKLGLLGYAGIRDYSFLSLTIGSQDRILPFLGLFALEFGVLAWDYYRKNTGDGQGPRAVALVMIAVCLAGVLAGVYGDTQIGAAENGLKASDPRVIEVAITAVWFVIGANIVALVAIGHLSTTQREKDQAQKVLEAEEETRAAIDDEVIRLVRSNRTQLAKAAAPEQAKEILARTGASPERIELAEAAEPTLMDRIRAGRELYRRVRGSPNGHKEAPGQKVF